MNTVYACKPEYMGYGPWTELAWHRSNNDIAIATDPSVPPVPRDDFDQTIADIPVGTFAGFNFEYVENTGYKFLRWHEHPAECEATYAEFVNRIHAVRPDLQYMFYTLPHSTNMVTKGSEWAEILARQETALAAVTGTVSHAGISAYWNYWNWGKGWDVWRRRMDYRIAMASTIHDKPIVAFVWDGEGHPNGRMPYTKLQQVLKYLKAREIPIAYWSYNANVHWSTRMLLAQFATGIFPR